MSHTLAVCPSSAVKATSDQAIQMIQAGGAQIFRLHTTSAPKKKDQSKPVLESYEFVPNHRVVAATPDFQEYLDCCSFVA